MIPIPQGLVRQGQPKAALKERVVPFDGIRAFAFLVVFGLHVGIGQMAVAVGALTFSSLSADSLSPAQSLSGRCRRISLNLPRDASSAKQVRTAARSTQRPSWRSDHLPLEALLAPESVLSPTPAGRRSFGRLEARTGFFHPELRLSVPSGR